MISCDVCAHVRTLFFVANFRLFAMGIWVDDPNFTRLLLAGDPPALSAVATIWTPGSVKAM